jgi:hypothetical protein
MTNILPVKTSVLLTLDRWPVWLLWRWRLQLTLERETVPVLVTHCTSSCRLLQPRRPCLGRCCPLAFTISFRPLPSRTFNTTSANPAGHSVGFLSGYIVVCSALTMGRLDRPRFHNFNHRFRRRHMRHEKDFGFSQGSQEEDC